MNLYLDTEFTGLHKGTTLISLGIIADNGRTFYAEFTDYDKTQVDEWIQENVINNLLFQEPREGEHEHNAMIRHEETNPVGNPINKGYSFEVRGTLEDIKTELTKWLQHFEEELYIWSDCLSYDWVLFNDVYGHAFNLPETIYYIPFDICTVFRMKGIDPDISREEFIGNSVKGVKHNALYDAKVIRECYKKLLTIENKGGNKNE